jgi:hypothetical protein
LTTNTQLPLTSVEETSLLQPAAMLFEIRQEIALRAPAICTHNTGAARNTNTTADSTQRQRTNTAMGAE